MITLTVSVVAAGTWIDGGARHLMPWVDEDAKHLARALGAPVEVWSPATQHIRPPTAHDGTLITTVRP